MTTHEAALALEGEELAEAFAREVMGWWRSDRFWYVQRGGRLARQSNRLYVSAVAGSQACSEIVFAPHLCVDHAFLGLREQEARGWSFERARYYRDGRTFGWWWEATDLAGRTYTALVEDGGDATALTRVRLAAARADRETAGG